MNPRQSHKTRRGATVACGALLVFGLGAFACATTTRSITPGNVVQHVVEAKTPADHEALAAYFRAKAAASANKAKWHEEMLQSYRIVGGRRLQIWKPHCESLIQAARAQQKEYERLAAEQEQLGKAAQRPK